MVALVSSPIAEQVLETTCRHCRLPLGASPTSEFCCRGCAEVWNLLESASLGRYYELGGGAGYPVVRGSVDRKWLEPIAARLAGEPGLCRVKLDVQGVHCAACVWLLDELFRRQAPEASGQSVLVNPAVGTAELVVGKDFPLERWVCDVEAFGYRFGPPLKAAAAGAPSSSLVLRMGVCIAIAMNTMIFGIAMYSGLAEGRVYRLFHGLDFGLSLVSVLVGGSVFFRSAWAGVRRGILHLDLPIALGIALAFTSSTYTYLTRGGSTSYFDTINVFIALMLVGRFLQERVVTKNRALILASDGVDSLYTRRVRGDAVELVRCTAIEAGDELLLAHQDLVPVDAELLAGPTGQTGQDPQDHATFSLDWINGESVPRAFRAGATVPAGAFCQDVRAARVRALGDFDASTIGALLRTSNRRDDDEARATPWWRKLTTVYVALVLTIAAVASVAWLLTTHDLGRSLDVVAAILIVTCPCSFGIATPLAYELAQAGLRRVGLFVRTPGFLDRATDVDKVVFDKTGTLTTGELVVAEPGALAALPEETRRLTYDLAIRSSHPRSRAIVAALEALGTKRLEAGREVREIAGKGMETEKDGHRWRLGAAGWAALSVPTGDVVLGRDGALVVAIPMREELRPDAKDEVRALVAAGYEPYVLSGDGPDATRRAAKECGISADHAVGGCTPEAKAAWLRGLGAAKTLFVGDGINDSLVAEEATCAGTPAIDRPFMASRCDFYIVSPGLRPIRAALETSRRLARVVRMNLALAVLYNVVTISLAVAGRMTPLWCAVLMPLSSVSTVLATTFRLRHRKAVPWTS